MSNKMSSVAMISPAGLQRTSTDKFKLYSEEKKAIEADFAALGNNVNWNDQAVKEKLDSFARVIMKNISVMVSGQEDLVSAVLPTETVQPGDTFKLREVHGLNVYYGTYGAAVRMSRPQFTEYTATTNLKEVGIRLDLAQIRTGKYSASELADYAANLIRAWRNRLLFTTTLAGMTVYGSGGAQYQAGTHLAFGTMNTAINKLTDEGDIKMIVGRRYAIHKLASMSGWSETSKEEFEKLGQVGKYAGIPVVKVNSFTDPDYGTVSPMPATELWIISLLPAGRAVIADAVRSSNETIMSNESMNIYLRWDDGIGIFKTNRIVRVAAIT